MNTFSFRIIVSLLLAPALLAGCISMAGLHTTAQTTDADQLQASRTLENVPASHWPQADWWKAYGDPQLDALIEEGLANSPSPKIAQDRVEQAIAVAKAAGAPGKPTLNATASGDYGGIAGITGDFDNGGFTFSMLQLKFGYDLDLWGKHRAAYESALDAVHASQIDLAASKLLLSTSIARAYIQLQQAYEQRDIAATSLEQRQHYLELTRQRVDAGIDSDVALKQAEALIPTIKQQLVQISETITLTNNQIAALVGRGPDRGLDIARPQLKTPAAFNDNATLPSNVPADLIGRRPDVMAQRWRINGASEDIKVAKAAFYPDINLSAFVGLNQINLGTLAKGSAAFAGAGPAISLPIYNGGLARADLAGKDAQYDAAVEQYNQTIVDALHDVVDQLTSLRSADAQRVQLDAALANAKEAYALAQQRFDAGIDNYLQVINAQQDLLQQESLDANLRAHALDLSINLIRSLGGGLYAPSSDDNANNASTSTTNNATADAH